MSQVPNQPIVETAFEKRRGIHRVEIRSGYAQVHVIRLADPLSDSRIELLKAIAEAQISIDFLKMTPGGISFMISDQVASSASKLLEGLGVQHTVVENLHIVLVFAANMRDEEGLIAEVLANAIRSGAALEHVTDMHDRMLIVVRAEDSDKLLNAFSQIEGNHHAH